MGASLNKVMIIGRLGKDPEVRSTSGGKSVANLSIATDESYKDGNGERQKKTEWVSAVVWGASVEAFVQPYLHKGDLVYIEGRLQTRSWEKDGVKKYTTEVNVTDIKGLVTGDGGSSSPTQNSRPVARPAARPTTRQVSQQVEDEDIPF
jgi:single-strand DNA-binding protein